MMKNLPDFPQLPEASYFESTMEALKASSDIFGSLIPILGPSISKILEYNISSFNKKRFEAFFQGVADYVKRLPEDIINTEEFASVIKKGVKRYVEEASIEKGKLVLNVYRSYFTLLKNSNDRSRLFSIYIVFDALFDQLSLPALVCLLHFEEKFKLKGTRYDIIQYFNELQEVHAKRCFLEMINNALLEEDGIYEMPPSFSDGLIKKQAEIKNLPLGQRVYKLTPLAGVFINWLKLTIKVE